MTTERDFDRLARAWLELGPDEAPDRVVAAVLQAAETTPQVRRRVGWSIWRSFHMTRLPIVATVVAALVVVIGGGMLFMRSNEHGVGGPTASPTPTSSAAAAAIPGALRYHWIGQPRDIPGLGTTTRTAIDFVSGAYFADGTDYPDGVFASGAVLASSDSIELVTATAAQGCESGDIGRYTYTLSPRGTRLSMTVESEDCAPREAATSGDWYRVDCKNVENGCWGELEAGTYPTQYFRPRLGVGVEWQPLLGDMTFTVPDGWANSADWPENITLTPSDDYAKETGSGPWHEIAVRKNPAAANQAAPCSETVDSDVPRTVDGLLAYLQSTPSVSAGEPTPITIDGYEGAWIDVQKASSWTGRCPNASEPVAMLIVGTGEDGYSIASIGAERHRLIFLDVGIGAPLLIDIESSDPARFDALVAEAMPIIQSFTFK